MDWLDELSLNLNARNSVINLVTSDEAWSLKRLAECNKAFPAGHGVYIYDNVGGISTLRPGQPGFDTSQVAPDKLLDRLTAFAGPVTLVIKDLQRVWKTADHLRQYRALRNLAQQLPKRTHRADVVLVTQDRIDKNAKSDMGLPFEMIHDVVVVECPIPDFDEMLKVYDATIEKVANPTPLQRKIVETALGLTATQAQRVFRRAATVEGRPHLSEKSIPFINEEKRELLREAGALEFCPRSKVSGEVGGLDVLRRWLEQRKQAFSERARMENLEPPRGLGLIGIPGTGKSLCAYLTAELWNLPLLRLDMGAVFEGLVGASERNMRDAIRIAEVVSPCVLWVDEVEKSFSSGGGDGGTAKRVLATFLTWMQKKTLPVFVFVTANDHTQLPPEFLRRGRFDEVFFLDLPTAEERKAILMVHLRRRVTTEPAELLFDLDAIVRETEGFVGAELEAMVKDAKFQPYLEQRALTTEDLLRTAGEIVPLARARKEDVEILRQVVIQGQARLASAADPADMVKLDQVRSVREPGGRRLDV